MALFALRKLFVVVALMTGALHLATAIQSGDPDLMFNSFNNAFLVRSGSNVFYKKALNDANPDPSWTGALDVLVAEDAYERTGDPAHKTLVNDLASTWLRNNPTPWTWNWWNDDLGWYSLALVRAYQITGNQAFLDNAKYGFDLAFSRGWDTQYNNGGIWEENPEGANKEKPPKELKKEALSNDSLGKVACLLYQATHDAGYLNKCQQIFDWVRTHIYNAETGQINTGVYRNGTVDTSSAAYNQGTFIDFAELVYVCKGDASVRAIGQKTLDFARNSLTKNGIFSRGGDLNTWADEVARGAGHYIQNHQLWDTYYDWMVQNSDAIMKNRRADLGITGNEWDNPTPLDNSAIVNKFASAAAWLQYTPITKPSKIGGLHFVVNQKTGLLLDNANKNADGTKAVQWGRHGGQTQRWHFSQNSDGSWNIISLSSFNALDCPNGAVDDNVEIIQWPRNRNANQRWLVEEQSDGSFQIRNKASGKSLDGASNSTNGAKVVQWGWNGESQQRWLLQVV